MKFKVNDESYELDVERLTFAEARAFERHSGISFMEALEKPELKAGIDALQALVFIAVKRKEPTTTFSDLDDVEISSIVADEDEDAEEPDEDAEDEGSDPTPPAASDEEPRHAIAAVS